MHSLDRIDPHELLPNWSGAELGALLRTGIFDDVVYTSVRFRHREIRELLSAEWAHDLLGQPGGRVRVEHLFFRKSYGEQVIVPPTRPTLAWLLLLDEEVRDKALALAPEIAKRRDRNEVQSREGRGFAHCKKWLHRGRMKHAARFCQSYKMSPVTAGQLHRVQARYDDSSR